MKFNIFLPTIHRHLNSHIKANRHTQRRRQTGSIIDKIFLCYIHLICSSPFSYHDLVCAYTVMSFIYKDMQMMALYQSFRICTIVHCQNVQFCLLITNIYGYAIICIFRLEMPENVRIFRSQKYS